MVPAPGRDTRIAVIGTGISGMAAGWLLGQSCDVTFFEQDSRLGGHSHTFDVQTPTGTVPVDTGFIVYNPANYPNLTALFAHLGVETHGSEMSFAVSRHGGKLEYAGNDLGSLFAQKRNAFSPAFLGMLLDLRRFYAQAPRDAGQMATSALTLGQYLETHRYGRAFREDHLLPMAAAIWSAPVEVMLDYPVADFVRFFENHGLLKLSNRPAWRTVSGGSRAYVERIMRGKPRSLRLKSRVTAVQRVPGGVLVSDASGSVTSFDHVVIAAHADQALAMLSDASAEERRLLSVFGYAKNLAVLHSDAALMPLRRRVWSSWNYMHSSNAQAGEMCVSYWMNRLQGLSCAEQLFVTLNPKPFPEEKKEIARFEYEHPVFTPKTALAQRELWSLQGKRNTWFCGSYFGAGFHEDGLQAGLAVAEDLGRVSRPWTVAQHSSRIFRQARPNLTPALEMAS